MIKTTRLDRPIVNLERDLRKWLDEIAHFKPSVNQKGVLKLGNYRIRIRDIKRRGLRVGIEPGRATEAHLELFKRIERYARQQGLAFVEFVEVF